MKESFRAIFGGAGMLFGFMAAYWGLFLMGPNIHNFPPQISEVFVNIIVFTVFLFGLAFYVGFGVLLGLSSFDVLFSKKRMKAFLILIASIVCIYVSFLVSA